MAQIKKKFLASNAVDGQKIQFSNNEAFRAKSSSGVDVELFKLDNSNVFQFIQLPRSSSDPVVDNDLSRKSYVDAQVLAEAAARLQADAAETAAREAAISAEQSARQAADSDLQDAIDAEVAAREAAVSAEQSRAEAAEAGLQSQIDEMDTGNAAALAAEVAAREAADEVLQDNIDTEKARIDAILLASDADKDSFAEIVSLINSVDTTNDSAFAAYVLSNDAALAQEVSDREAGDSALQDNLDAEQAARESADSALSGRLDVVEGSDTTEGSVAKAEKDAKDYADSVVEAEQTRAETAEAALQEAIDDEEAARIAAVSGEEAARMAADSGIQSELDATQAGAGLGVDGGYTAPVGSAHLGSATSLKDADSKLDAAIVAESNARQTAVSNLEQSISDLDAAMTQGFDDAQAYTDSKVAALVDGAPALLDTLNELAAAIGDDENFASNILTSVANETAARQAADTAEAQARSEADSTLQANIDAEQAAREAAVAAEQARAEAAEAALLTDRLMSTPEFMKTRYTLTSTDISNGYVDLDNVAMEQSINVFIDRLACHAMDDYTVSVEGNVTRITFTESFMTSGEAPEAGDLFRCSYAFRGIDQPVPPPFE